MADRSFGPTLLGGLGSAGLLALAGNSDWMRTGSRAGAEDAAGGAFVEADAGVGQMPLAGALGLVLLACWGVLLVSRGLVRRLVAWAALVTAVAVLAVWVVGLVTLEDEVRAALDAAAPGMGRPGGSPSWTGWFWLAGVAALVAVAAAAVTVRSVGRWPAMGERYDAPTGRAAASSPALADGTDGEVDPADWWKALDEGRDPTGDGAP